MEREKNMHMLGGVRTKVKSVKRNGTDIHDLVVKKKETRGSYVSTEPTNNRNQCFIQYQLVIHE